MACRPSGCSTRRRSSDYAGYFTMPVIVSQADPLHALSSPAWHSLARGGSAGYHGSIRLARCDAGARRDTLPATRSASRRKVMAGDMLSGAVAVTLLVVILAAVYYFATGQSPWPVFVLAELPGAGFGF